MMTFAKLALAASLLTAAAPALATNNGFEAALTGWSSSGNAGTTNLLSTSNTSLTPHSGASFGYVASDSKDVYQTLSQTFKLAAGGTIAGQVAFLTNDYLPYNDDGYLSVNGVNLFASSVAAVGAGNGTGWTAFNFVAPTTGKYTLQIGVANRADGGVASFTALDSVAVTGGVPEPATWALMLGGFGLAGASMRRRRSAAVYA